jgi:hypothetical protein
VEEKTMGRKNYLWGIFLIAVGILLLLDRIFSFDILAADNFWPIFVLIPGLIFEISYFSSRRNPGLLVPGGILTTIGILFFFESFTNWSFAEYTWLVYPLSVAIGLLQLYLFSGRPSGLLIPVFILTAVSIVSFVSMVMAVFDFTLIFAALAIILGIYILYKSYIVKK